MLETPNLEYVLQDGTRLPLYSLYSATREPTPEQLATVDTLVVYGLFLFPVFLYLGSHKRHGAGT
jgi:hypothetical protein